MHDDELTPTWERREIERDPDAVITVADLETALSSVIRKVKAEQSSWRQESSRELKLLMSRPSSEEADKLAADIKEMHENYKFMKRITMLIGAPIFALAVWYVRERVASAGDQSVRDATIELRLQRVEADLQRLRERMYNQQDRP